MSEKKTKKITFKREELENITAYLEEVSRKLYHINHALFDPEYKSTLDFNNGHDRRHIKMTLFMAVASINGEVRTIEKKLNEEE